ncbi:MAG: Crp/Fnr family transcriptional regulator [Candidatus Accumulibacter sp.]|jgi:CRP-like cAMP-binding protein|nr:Crp/Fnr family transcriptional regulator [Accumulibacter sp.]
MDSYFETCLTLKKCPLFTDISEGDLESLLSCLSGRRRNYSKGETLLAEGGRLSAVGIVLSGSVHIVKEDFFGNCNIIAEISEGALFGEAIVCAEAERSPVNVIAAENSAILFIDYGRIVTTCPSACKFHSQLIKNMLRVLGQKNMSLVDKLEHITKRTIREKALSYLSGQAKQRGRKKIEIPFDRQQLADFLSVERSALSAELSRLRDEGIIKFQKNKFELLPPLRPSVYITGD